MEMAIVESWKGPVPGRERDAIALFGESMAAAQHRMNEGVVTDVQYLNSPTGDMRITRGPRDVLLGLMTSPEMVHLMNRASLCVRDYDVRIYAAGETALEWATDFGETAAQMGYAA